MKINEKIRNAMIEHDLTFKELSKKTGISPSSLQSYASGRSKKIPMPVILKLTEAFGVDFSYWMDAEFPTPSHSYVVGSEYAETLRRLAESSPEQIPVRNFMAELMDLVNLYEKGLLTDEEFAAGKRFIMQMTLKDEN